MRDLPGDLGRYSLGDELGQRSGEGAAFRALRDDGLACVIKLIHGFVNPSSQELDRLSVKLEQLATVRSDHVVRIIDVGVDRTAAGALPWVAMPLVHDARSLRAVIAQSTVPLGPAAARSIGIAIAQGLADLHAANLLHRAVRPGHVLLDADGRPLLIDFELARIQQLTARASVVGEPPATGLYAAPEQLRGPVVPQSDLWALGLILVELLTGSHPVKVAAARRKDVRGVIVAGHLVSDELPREWRELIDALLQKVPVARPGSAQSVVEWLEAGSRRLVARPVRESPAWRWEVRSRDDVAAAEHCAGGELDVRAVDARGRARSDRLRHAVRAIPATLAFEPAMRDTAQLTLDGCDDDAIGDVDGLEGVVYTALSMQRDADTDEVLLPWKPVGAAGIGEAIDVLRSALDQRGVVAGKRVIATVQLPAGALTRRGDALEIASVLCALRPDGWRLLVDGLQPGCGPNALVGTADMAVTLAERADVWVRAGGLARWLMATLPGVSVLARCGRGLWTRGDGFSSNPKPERVEVPRLAGPVPRDVAECLAEAQPALLACDCWVCAHSHRLLPTRGALTIVHNALVIDAQLAALRHLPAAVRRERFATLLHAAIRRRAALPELIEWNRELDDLHDILAVIEGRTLTPRTGFKLLRFA